MIASEVPTPTSPEKVPTTLEKNSKHPRLSGIFIKYKFLRVSQSLKTTSGVHLDPRHLDPRHLDPRHLDPRHLDPRYCTVYNTVEAGVQMSNFGNKVGHLDPRHLDPWYSTVYKTVETGVQMSNFGNKVGHLDPC